MDFKIFDSPEFFTVKQGFERQIPGVKTAVMINRQHQSGVIRLFCQGKCLFRCQGKGLIHHHMFTRSQRHPRQREMGVIRGRDHDEVNGRVSKNIFRRGDNLHIRIIRMHFGGITARDFGQFHIGIIDNKRRMECFSGKTISDQAHFQYFRHHSLRGIVMLTDKNMLSESVILLKSTTN